MKSPTKPIFLAAVLLVLLTAACKPTPTPLPPTRTPEPVQVTYTPVPPSPMPVTDTPAAPPKGIPTEPPPFTGLAFVYLDMLTESTGWALTTTSVVRTTDGGETWTDVSPDDWSPDMLPSSAFFRNELHAWVIQTDPVDFERGTFYHTSDSGASWLKYDVPFGAGMMSFYDNRNGWIMVGLGAGAGSQAIAIFVTHDGGASWSETYRRDTGEPEPEGEIPLVGSKQGITFRDSSHGYVTGSIPMDNFSYLYSSNDGGFHFQQQNIPLPDAIDTAMLSLEAPIFFTGQEGILPVYLYTPDAAYTVFYTTSDGGTHWTPTALLPVLGRFSAPELDNWFVWDGNTLYHSTDIGETWDEVNPNINLDSMISTLDFVDGQNGWVTWVDADGVTGLSFTADGGATWTALQP